MVADQGHKSAAFQHLCGEGITTLFDEPQFLMFGIPHRENHAAAFGQLSKERLRNPRSGRGNQDGVEGGEFRQTQCAVAAVNMRVGEPSRASVAEAVAASSGRRSMVKTSLTKRESTAA